VSSDRCEQSRVNRREQPPTGGGQGESPAGARDGKLGRAYRSGRLVCGCVHVTVRYDDRLGLTQPERRLVAVRFHEPLDDDVRAELDRLVRQRGSAALRAAERIDPIEVVVDDPHGARVRIIGWLLPPQVRHRQLRDVEFGLREHKRSR